MKIIKNDKVYIQYYDVAYLNSLGFNMSESPDYNYKFYEIEDPIIMDGIKDNPYIIDYNQIRNLKISALIKKMNEIAQIYKNETNDLVLAGLAHLYLSYEKFLDYKEGHEIFLLPCGVLYPVDHSCIVCQNKMCDKEAMKKAKDFSYNPPGYDCLSFMNSRDKSEIVYQLKK